MTLVKRVSEMEMMPRGYAVAWWLEHERRALCLPIGVHAIVSWLRARWISLKVWHDASLVERAYMRGYRAGQSGGAEAGRREGFRHGYDQAQREEAARQAEIGALIEGIKQELAALRMTEETWKR